MATIIRFNKKCSCHAVPMMKSKIANEPFSSVPQMPGQRNVGFTYYKKTYTKLPEELLAENDFHLFFTS